MSTWVLKQWPVPLAAAMALVLMLAVQRFGVTVELPAALGAVAAALAVGFLLGALGDPGESTL